VVFKSKKENEEKANDNENKQINPTNSETPRKLDELLTSPLRKENKEKEKNKEKEEHAQQILQQQPASDENKQNKGHHSALRRYSKWIAALGGVLGYGVAVEFAAGFSTLEILVIDLASVVYLLPYVVAALIVVKQEEKKKMKEKQKNSEENLQPIVENKEEQKKNRNEDKENKEEKKNSEEGSTI